jgi:hypothetical protein
MESGEQPNQGATPPTPPPTTAQTPSAATGNTIGYCHECDRQVEIDMVNFVCTNCNGGFIEMFELNSREQGGTGGASAQTPETAQPRNFRFDANSANNMEASPQLITFLSPQTLFYML